MNPVANQIEALLFSEGGSMKKTHLMRTLEISGETLVSALAELSARLQGGLSLIQSETEVALVISAAAGEAVKKAREKEMGKEIGDAGLEVLSILLYKGPCTRAEIDYIRGVNTSSTIRNLLGRGLVERAGNPLDGREFIYRPTSELLAHLGVHEGRELPDFERISNELLAFEKRQESFAAQQPKDTSHGTE